MRLRFLQGFLLAGLTLLLAIGCGGGQTVPGSSVAAPGGGTTGVGSTGTSGSSGGTGTAAPVSFSGQIQPIFTANCALSGCHAADTAQEGQILDAGQSYANIVNVTSTEEPPEKRVLPGDSAHSYLYQKISQAQPAFGSQMPLGANPLPAAQIALIKAWIDEGAPP